MEWEYKSAFARENYNTNVFLACLTTSHARLQLYEALQAVGEQSLYADTDSVIYVKRPGGPQIALGSLLGQFTDELDGEHITEFVSGGCKQYAYRCSNGKETCKVRGFTLNYNNSKVINFDSVRQLVLENRDGELKTINPSKICRNKDVLKVYNKPEEKVYRMVSNKRTINWETLDTLPFGY